MKKFLLVFTLTTLVCSYAVLAQSTVSGKVTDATDGSGLPGVNVIEKGTTNGTVTDFDGNYTLSVSSGATIVFSFVGYTSQETVVGSRSVIDISLETDVTQLSEVVVVGYGVQEKKDITGAVASVDAEQFNRGVINNPAELIQGKVAGVNVVSSSGEPGAGITVQVRGAGSVRANNDPLYVVDGVPLDGRNITPGGTGPVGGGSQSRNPLNFLNPDDIETIDVLKDASATAIYGSRGANGVVIITTKKGASGEGQLSYSGYLSVANIREELDVLDANEYETVLTDLGIAEAGVNLFGGNTDWQDEVFRTAITHSHNVAYGGGTEKTNYRVSLSALDQQGIVENTSLERYTGRINVTQKALDDRLKLDLNMTIGNTQDQAVPIGDRTGFDGDVISLALVSNPTSPVFNEDGTLLQRGDIRNPVALIELVDDKTSATRFLGNIGAEFTIIEGLSYKFNFGLDHSRATRESNFSNLLTFTPGQGDIQYRELNSKTFEHYFNYNKTFGESTLTALAGYSYQEFRNEGHSISATNFTGDILPTNNIDALDNDVRPNVASDAEVNELQSFFGRVTYSLKDKYLLTANFRADGSTRFGEDNEYGFFPAVAVGWRISDEDFMPQGIFTDLKLRLGWGQTGNQELPNKVAGPAFRFDPNQNGIVQDRVANPDLQWETTTQINIGLDFGVLGGRLSGTIDYFNKVTTDLLLRQVPLPPAVATEFWDNLDAEVVNNGIELGLQGVIVDNNDWNVTANVNFALIDNEVKDLNQEIPTGEINGQGLSGVNSQVIRSGESLGAFFLVPFVGFDENGNSVFLDINGEQTTSPLQGDRRIVGSALPDFTWNFTGSVSYKAFDLNFALNASHGNDVYNNTANALFVKSALNNSRNTTVDNAATNESLSSSLQASSRFLEDGSFIRLQIVTLGYIINTEKIPFINSARVYATGQNLFVLTDYTGFDPEVNTDKNVNGVPSLGVDYTSYPRARTFLVGVNLTF
ncbi:MAG: TonB-dependent receptor [Bacteroidota bacterium]